MKVELKEKRAKRASCLASSMLLWVSISLFSCASITPGPYAYGQLDQSQFEEVEGEGYYRVGEFKSLQSNGKTIPCDFSSIFQSGNINLNIPSTGEVPLLVIPVDFEDNPGESYGLSLIERAFKGNVGYNQYVSVAEFFDTASKGRLHLNPTVAPSYFRSSTYPTIDSLSSIFSSSGTTNALTKIYEEALVWLSEAYPDWDLGDYSFLSKANKSILPVYFVYNAPYSGEEDGESSRNSMMWAFTINRPAPIAWSSIDMLHDSGGKVDAHTFIHETGHLFGLEDYYDTSSSDLLSRTSHLGRMDIMDSSLGDHNAFSKMLLDWERPFVPTADCRINIHQSSGNNESILFSPSWNGTPYDQYLLMEFYTPTNLNYTDAFLRSDETMRLFQRPGVKIYSVNATLDLYNGYYSTGKALTPNNYNGERLYFGKKNSSFTFPLIQLLNKHQNNASPTPYFIASDHEDDVSYFSGGQAGTAHLSEALFFEGDSIDSTHFSDIRINGMELGCSIKIEKVTSSYATISFAFDK